MATLRVPDTSIHRSFLEAVGEYQAEGRGEPNSDSMLDREIRDFHSSWQTEAGFADFIAYLVGQAQEETPRPDGHVPCSTRWWVESNAYIGRVAIRHRLSDRLLQVGGHIGYDVRPSARRRGHATAMLRAALPEARRLGIESALITCDLDNVASRRVIESNGGVFDDERQGKLRFWVPTG